MRKNSLPILIIAAILAGVFGLTNSQSQQFASLLVEQMLKPSGIPSSTQLPITNQSVQGTSDMNISRQQAQVIKVVDGDTIKVSIDNTEETIRMIGINTPESVDPRRKVECFGKEASAHTKQLLTSKTVYLEADPSQSDRDKYQRLLRYVWVDATTNINKLLIADGYAYEYTYDLPYKYQNEFKQAQTEAQNAKRGLWSNATCNGLK